MTECCPEAWWGWLAAGVAVIGPFDVVQRESRPWRREGSGCAGWAGGELNRSVDPDSVPTRVTGIALGVIGRFRSRPGRFFAVRVLVERRGPGAGDVAKGRRLENEEQGREDPRHARKLGSGSWEVNGFADRS